MTDVIAAPQAALQTVDQAKTAQGLRAVAQELEVHFLSVMLKDAGVGRPPEGFGGGAGEDQFSSYLREAQARAMAEAGGLGLAEMFFESLQERADAK